MVFVSMFMRYRYLDILYSHYLLDTLDFSMTVLGKASNNDKIIHTIFPDTYVTIIKTSPLNKLLSVVSLCVMPSDAKILSRFVVGSI